MGFIAYAIRLVEIRRRSLRAHAFDEDSMRVFTPLEIVAVGAMLYLFFRIMMIIPNSPFTGTSLFGVDPHMIWSILAVGGALAIAIQVLASQTDFDEQNSTSRRRLTEQAEKYIAVTPVVVAVVVVVLVFDYLLQWFAGLTASHQSNSFPELLAVIAFGWVLVVLCADAKNRFNGNSLLRQERVRLVRRRTFREIRMLQLFQPPRPGLGRGLFMFMGGLSIEITSVLGVTLLVRATVFVYATDLYRTPIFSERYMETVLALLPGSVGLAAVLWVYISMTTLILGSFRYVDSSYKAICVLLLILFLGVTLQALAENWVIGVLLIVVLAMSIMAQSSNDVFQEKIWLFPSLAVPGNGARQFSAKKFWNHYESLRNAVSNEAKKSNANN